MNELIEQTIKWGEEHGINNPWTQASKVTEEWGETVSEMNHDRYGDAFEDGIGDVLVSLIIFAHINGKDVKNCLKKSLEEIEGRAGRTLDGNFIKSEENKSAESGDNEQEVVILKNAFYCKKCKMLVESKSVHDYAKCKCGNSTDGGLDYIRRGGNFEDMEDRSEFKIGDSGLPPQDD